MGDILFYDVAIDRASPISGGLMRIRHAGFSVSGDYEEGYRLIVTDRPNEPAVKMAIVKPEGELASREDYVPWAGEHGLRLATLQETLELARVCTELFKRPDGLPLVVLGDPFTIDGDAETWVALFPKEAPLSLCVAPLGDPWGAAHVPVVQL